ncbi:MAG: hypothetical protein WAU86_11645 [Oricola sp.]
MNIFLITSISLCALIGAALHTETHDQFLIKRKNCVILDQLVAVGESGGNPGAFGLELERFSD